MAQTQYSVGFLQHTLVNCYIDLNVQFCKSSTDLRNVVFIFVNGWFHATGLFCAIGGESKPTSSKSTEYKSCNNELTYVHAMHIYCIYCTHTYTYFHLYIAYTVSTVAYFSCLILQMLMNAVCTVNAVRSAPTSTGPTAASVPLATRRIPRPANWGWIAKHWVSYDWCDICACTVWQTLREFTMKHVCVCTVETC